MEIENMHRIKNDRYLPNDVLNEILLRLPAKSLGRFKCVCRSWNNLIQNPTFIKNHYDHPQNPTLLFGLSRTYGSNIIGSTFDESFSHKQDIRHPVSSQRYVDSVLGPVNGLFLMSYYTYEDRKHIHGLFHQLLWNPTTSEFRELTLPTPNRPCATVGFGSAGKDVKLVSLNWFKDPEKAVTVYSLADDCWKNIKYDSVRFPYINRPIKRENYTHVNGVLYWLLELTDRNILLLFDFKIEEFREVNLPPICPDNTSVYSKWVRDNSSIVLFVNEYKDKRVGIHLWEMKVEGEWSKLMSFDRSSIYMSSYPDEFGFWKKDELIIRIDDYAICETLLYNIHSHITRRIEIGMPHAFIFFNYKESLTSVSGYARR